MLLFVLLKSKAEADVVEDIPMPKMSDDGCCCEGVRSSAGSSYFLFVSVGWCCWGERRESPLFCCVTCVDCEEMKENALSFGCDGFDEEREANGLLAKLFEGLVLDVNGLVDALDAAPDVREANGSELIPRSAEEVEDELIDPIPDPDKEAPEDENGEEVPDRLLEKMSVFDDLFTSVWFCFAISWLNAARSDLLAFEPASDWVEKGNCCCCWIFSDCWRVTDCLLGWRRVSNPKSGSEEGFASVPYFLILDVSTDLSIFWNSV